MNYDNIGKFIKEKRKNANLTQKELASRVGVTDKAISKWETGRGIPDISILDILAKELNCSIIEILKGEDISNDDIKKSDIDNYIKEGINYGKDKYKNFINKIISFLIIFVVLLVFGLNVINIYNQHKKYYPSNNGPDIIHEGQLDVIKGDVEDIKILISKLRNNRGNYNEAEYERITSILNNLDETLNNDLFLKYNGEGLTLNEIYLNEYDLQYKSSIFGLASTIYNKGEKDNNYLNLVYSLAFKDMADYYVDEYSSMYKYELYNPFILRIYMQNRSDIIVSNVYNRISYTRMIKFLLNEVIEVGDINE